MHERLIETQIAIPITNSPTQNSANHITSSVVGWQLSIGNTHTYRTNMVGNYPKGNVLRFVIAVIFATQTGSFLNDKLENICIVIRRFTLNYPNQTLKSHSGINMLCRKFFQRAVGLSVKLHEHVIPNFNHFRIVFVYQCGAIHFSTVFIRTHIKMDFSTGSTRTRIAHFPEIIFFISVDYF